MTAEKKPQFPILIDGCHCRDAPMSPLFSIIDGTGGPDDDQDYPVVEYHAPDYLEAHVGLEYLELMITQGSDYALRWALIKVLGQDGWDALRSPGMSYESFMEVADEVLRRVRGSTSPKGK